MTTMQRPLTREVEALFASREVRMPEALGRIYESDLPDRLSGLLYLPAAVATGDDRSLEWAESQIEASDWPLLPNLVPVLPIDERSFACVVASDLGGEPLPGEGAVVRWHLSVTDESQQAAVMDVDCFLYAESIAEEMTARQIGLDRMLDVVGPAYQESYLDNEKRPRPFIVRPVRVACQNVIMGLAAIAQDSTFDGLSVVAWQTCEAPHVAAHEANRALAALTLCDAFQNGGTMEIQFDREASVELKGETRKLPGHPEHGVPASLRRYARTVGVDLGTRETKSISPAKARELFRAITPMPDDLRERVDIAIDERGISPERLCFTLLNPVWRDIELDFLLATSARVESILQGGAPWEQRGARQAESEACRAAVIAGMLYRRLNATDAPVTDGEARVIEDLRIGVRWDVLPEVAAVRFTGIEAGAQLPWSGGIVAETDSLTVFPRSFVTTDGIEQALAASALDTCAVVIPRQDSDGLTVPDGLVLLQCPDRLADIDKAVEAKLLTARISRG
jgi:hypothetical protein